MKTLLEPGIMAIVSKGDEVARKKQPKNGKTSRMKRARIVKEGNRSLYSIKVSIVMKRCYTYDAEPYSTHSISHSLARYVHVCVCGCLSSIKTISSFVLLHCVHSIGKFSAHTIIAHMHTRTRTHPSPSLRYIVCEFVKMCLCIYNIGTST